MEEYKKNCKEANQICRNKKKEEEKLQEMQTYRIRSENRKYIYSKKDFN